MYGWLDRIKKRLFSFASAASKEEFSQESISTAKVDRDQPSKESDEQNEQSTLTHHDVQRLSTRIDHCRKALPQTCGRTEADFLNIGKRLQEIFAEAERLAKMAQEAIGWVAKDTEENAPADIIDAAQKTLVGLKKEQSNMTNHVGTISSLCEHIRKLNTLTVGFGRIAKDLKMVAINIKIESTRDEASRESFEVLSQEIRDLSNTVSDLGQTLREEIQAITKKIEAMGQTVTSDLRRLNRLTDDAQQVIDRAIPEYKALMTNSVQALGLVSKNSASISQSTSQIVVNLQIHDNVSQRVDHVAQALADANNLLSAESPAKQAQDDDRERVSAVYTNLSLQGSQLAKIVSDIDAVYQESTRAFGVLDDTVRDIISTIMKISRGNDTDALDGEDTFGSLDSFTSALEIIENLISKSDEAVDGISVIGQDATSAAASIEGHIKSVKKINFDIHLKSLNAIFKSVHLGDQGRSIGVLVQEMKTLATQSNELVEEIESINKTIIDDVHQLKSDIGQKRTKDQHQTANGERHFDDLVKDFFHSHESFNRHSDEMATLGKRLGKLIEAAGTHLSFIIPFAQELTSFQEQLDASCQDVAPWCHPDRMSALDGACLSDRYTMEQERIVHESVLKGDSGQRSDDAQQENDFDDNVELF